MGGGWRSPSSQSESLIYALQKQGDVVSLLLDFKVTLKLEHDLKYIGEYKASFTQMKLFHNGLCLSLSLS